jgi:ribosomal protein L16/L10AE
MGKGTGTFSHWSVKIKAGTVLFEVFGVAQSTVISAFKTGGAKLPIKTMILF